MKHTELMEKYEAMVRILGKEKMLEELVDALEDNVLQENLEFIDRMQDLDLFN